MILTIILSSILVSLVAIYFYVRRNYGYLESLGIPVIKPKFVFGSIPMVHKIRVDEFDRECYKKYGSVWGLYEGSVPTILVADSRILRQILVKDFDHFVNKRTFNWDKDEKTSTLDIIKNEKWKNLRRALTPVFTTGKLKTMVNNTAKSADKMIHYLESSNMVGKSVNIKPIYQYMALDVITNCAFGIDVCPFENPKHPLITGSQSIFEGFTFTSATHSIMWTMYNIFPGLMDYLEFMESKEQNMYIYNLIVDVIKNRMSQKSFHSAEYHDFIDFLCMLMEKREENNLSKEIIAAQGILFILAGYETTSNALSSLTYHLACNPDKEEILYEEVSRVSQEHNGVIDQDAIKDMPYLEACILETLRISPPLTRLERICEKDWEFEGLKIRKGTLIQVPVSVLHNDEKNFVDPGTFEPERFLKGRKEEIKPYTFMPFGEGPRVCIGMRFAEQQMKIVMAKLLNKFKFVKNKDTKIVIEKGSILFLFSKDMYVTVESRN